MANNISLPKISPSIAQMESNTPIKSAQQGEFKGRVVTILSRDTYANNKSNSIRNLKELVYHSSGKQNTEVFSTPNTAESIQALMNRKVTVLSESS